MNKEEFLSELRSGLSGLPSDEIDGRVSFYGEMIDDRIEEGAGEEEAVAGIGTVDQVVSQILSEIPLTKIVKEKIRPKEGKRSGWRTVLIILGFPLWFPLLVAAAAVLLSLYIAVWAVIISLWAVEAAFIISTLAGFAAFGAYMILGDRMLALAYLGAGLFLAGLSILFFFACAAASHGMILLTKKMAIGVKRLFIRKEGKQEK